jgi:hypothetical protein
VDRIPVSLLRVASLALVVSLCWGCDSKQTVANDTDLEVIVELDVCSGTNCFTTGVPDAKLIVKGSDAQQLLEDLANAAGKFHFTLDYVGQVCVVAEWAGVKTSPSCPTLDGSPQTLTLRFTQDARVGE